MEKSGVNGLNGKENLETVKKEIIHGYSKLTNLNGIKIEYNSSKFWL